MSHPHSLTVLMNENRHNAGKKDPRELLRRAKEGDEGAFGALYEIYYTPVYRYLFLRSRSKADAEDIAQTVFVKVYASLERFEIHEEPLCYFFSVARNALIDFHRKKTRKRIFRNGSPGRGRIRCG
jgi:RNA polymerase sigma-70 factor (ECF subfamily)